MNFPKLLIIILLIAPGVCLMAAAAFTYSNTAEFLSRTVQTKAVVIDLRFDLESGDAGGWVPAVRFVDAQGVEHIAESGFVQYNEPSRIGDELDILYDPDNPEATFWTPSNVWSNAKIFTAASLGFTALGLFLVIMNNKFSADRQSKKD